MENETDHKARLTDFCTDQLQQLESTLDGWTEHARGIHQRLLVRFRTNLKKTFTEANEEQAEHHTTTEIRVEEDSDEDDPDEIPASTGAAPSRWQYAKDLAQNQQYAPPPLPTSQERYEAAQQLRTESKQSAPADIWTPPSQQQPKYADPEYQIGRLRSAHNPAHLQSRDHKAVTIFYNAFVDFLQIYRVPIKILDDLRIDMLDDPEETLYPADLKHTDPQLLRSYSAAIYAKLEAEGVLDTQDQLFKGLLGLHNSRRDGYQVLQSILAATLLVHAKNIGMQSTSPTASPGTTPHEYACRLADFYTGQRRQKRTYSQREQATMFLQGLVKESDYVSAIQKLLQDLAQIPIEITELPNRFRFPDLPMTLLTHPATLQPNSNPATINVTNATYRRPADQNSSHSGSRPGSDHKARGRSYDRDASRDRSRSTSTASHTSKQQRSLPKKGRPVLDIQCEGCSTHGHHVSTCKLLPRMAAVLDYITAHPHETKEQLSQFRRLQHPDAKKASTAAREHIIKVLQSAATHEDIADQLTGLNYDHEDYNASIYRIQHGGRNDEPEVETLYCQFTDDVTSHIHPVKYPRIDKMPVRTVRPPAPKTSPMTVAIHQTQIDTRRDLADTGASVSATGDGSILHDFTSTTHYDIKGYDGQSTRAAGQGYAHIRNPRNGTIDKMLFVYVPSVTGTIISLEHHAQTNTSIHRWSQEATPATNTGWVTFYAKDDHIVSRYPTVKEKGLYYIQDLAFLPVLPPTNHRISQVQDFEMALHGAPIADDSDDETIQQSVMPTMYCEDYDEPLHQEHSTYQMNILQTSNTHPLNVPTTTNTRMSKLTKDVLTYETWHHRFGHCSAQRLRRTQKLADGIPNIDTKTLPPIITCRICDVAKLRKAPRGDLDVTDLTTIECGQSFSMDIGFIRGPSNLPEVLSRTEEPALKIIESRHGYVCYLLIIDKRSRYTWVFPLKSKSVPLELVRTFLTTHGSTTARNRTIRTDGEGSLAESSQFRRLVQNPQFGYILQKTATDSSSQNGLAERPHQTLATMVRCLLYSASLTTLFWADALVYAVYVNNRLYHSGIDAIPYAQWTGKRPNLKHIRAFGAHVSVRKSGHRPTKTDPHYYSGRFLRFGATEKNIVYYDTKTHRDKMGRHCTMDEFHYGTPAIERPLGAQQLIEKTLPHHTTPADQLGNDVDGATEYANDDPNATVVPIDAIDLQDRGAHKHTTATAAQLLGDAHQAEILHLDTSMDMYGPTTILRVPINALPTLGILVQTDQDSQKVFVKGCQEGTAVSRIPRWRTLIRNSVIRRVNNQPITSRSDMVSVISAARLRHEAFVTIAFAKIDVRVKDDDDIPQLHFDQLRHINNLLIELQCPESGRQEILLNYTRAKLRKRDDFETWRKSEWAQHDKYKLQNMFGDPIPRPIDAIVLPFVWTYMEKEDPLTGILKPKSRATCNGGKRYGKAVTVAETYATCVEQPACRTYWGITASESLVAMGADAGNAFAEAPPATQVFYMRIDEQYNEWWTEHLGNPPIPPGYVLPVNHALQGHPEAPRLWETHIHNILVNKMGFQPTPHEKCLYSRRPDHDSLEMILRQVDDFSVSANTQDTCKSIITIIGSHLTVPLNDLGIIRKFNGVNVQQTRWFIKISCEDYLSKILLAHQWHTLKASNLPIPMRSDSKYQRSLETAIRPSSPQEQQHVQQQAGFSYRMTTGELIYALVVARPEISFAVIKLSQYGENPALEHYQAIKTVYAFLNNTKEDGLIYWRKRPRMDLPFVEPQATRSSPIDRMLTPKTDIRTILAYSDSDWGSDTTHRRSVTGTIILLAGAAVLYSTKYQKAVALSSTEAEFVSASDTGKTALYIRTLLTDLGFLQSSPTKLLIDNTGAAFMVDAQASTKRTRHVDIRYFALLQWSTSGQLKAEAIKTDENISDSMTKPTGRIKFHQHADIFMGRQTPSYVSLPPTNTSQSHTIASFIHVLAPLETFSALHHPIYTAFVFHPTDIVHDTEHGRVRGYRTRTTVATS